MNNFDQYGVVGAHELREIINNEQQLIEKYDSIARSREDNGDIAGAGYYKKIASVHRDIKERVEEAWRSQEESEKRRMAKGQQLLT